MILLKLRRSEQGDCLIVEMADLCAFLNALRDNYALEIMNETLSDGGNLITVLWQNSREKIVVL